MEIHYADFSRVQLSLYNFHGDIKVGRRAYKRKKIDFSTSMDCGRTDESFSFSILILSGFTVKKIRSRNCESVLQTRP